MRCDENVYELVDNNTVEELIAFIDKEYVECNAVWVEDVAKFTLKTLHGTLEHRKWQLRACINYIEGEDINFKNKLKSQS